MLEQVNHRFVCGFLLFAGFGACGYEAPTAGESVASVSSSSSGAGGMGGAEQSSSSGTSEGDGGLISSSGVGGVGGFVPDAGIAGGAGGSGNAEMTSSSSSSSGGGTGGSGSPSDPIVSDCENGDCHTSPIATICCKGKTIQDSSNCTVASAVCPFPSQYAMECDDLSDCEMGSVCCMEFGRAECQSSCNGTIVCKTEADCPMGQACIIPAGTVMYCGQK